MDSQQVLQTNGFTDSQEEFSPQCDPYNRQKIPWIATPNVQVLDTNDPGGLTGTVPASCIRLR